MPSPAQIKAARALIGWTQRDLATKAKVSMASLANYERGASTLMANNLAAIQAALEAAGIIFLNGTSPGVRMRVPPVRADIGVMASIAAAVGGRRRRWREAEELSITRSGTAFRNR